METTKEQFTASLEAQVVHCRRCGRLLKNPKTVAAGIGKVCERKEALEQQLAADLGPGRITPAGYQTSFVDENVPTAAGHGYGY